jgi:hypothetical protein
MPQEKCLFKGDINLSWSSINGRYFQCPECRAYRTLSFGVARRFPTHDKNTLKRERPAFHWDKETEKWEYRGVTVNIGIAHEV